MEPQLNIKKKKEISVSAEYHYLKLKKLKLHCTSEGHWLSRIGSELANPSIFSLLGNDNVKYHDWYKCFEDSFV